MNQVALGIWWHQNNSPLWMTYSQIFYAIVNEGLGQNLLDYQVFQEMSATYFQSPSDINTYLLPSDPVTD